MKDHDERLAVLETRIEIVEKKQDEVLALQRAMADQLSRYKGFLGGIVFLGTAIWTFITWLIPFLNK